MAELASARNNALPYPIYAQPFVLAATLLDADGDGVAGSSPDSEISKNFDTAADCTNEFVDVSGIVGGGYLILTGAEMTCDVAYIEINSTGAKSTHYTLYPRKLPVVRTGTTQAGSGSTITLDSGASAIDGFYNGMVIAAVIDTVTELRMIGSYVGSTKVATLRGPDFVTATPDADDTFTIYLPEGHQIFQADVGYFGGVAGTFSGGRPEVNTSHAAGTAWNSGAIGAATIADGAIDRAALAADTGLQPIRSGTAQAGAASTITLDASASATTNFYRGLKILLTGATGAGQERLCTAYDGTTKVATITPNWTTNPDATTTFAVKEARVNLTTIGSDAQVSTAGILDVNLIQWRGTQPNALSSNRVDVTVGVMQANVVTAASAASDLTTELQTGLATSAALATVAGYLDTEVAAILALLDDARGEPGQGAPPVNPDLATKIDYLYKAWRNKKTQTATLLSIFADDAVTVDHKSVIADDGTTASRAEMATGA